MRIGIRPCFLGALAVVLLMSLPAVSAVAEDFYYGIEMKGALCGYSHIKKTSPVAENGREFIRLEQRVFVMLTLLGSNVNATLEFTYHIDPATGNFTYHSSEIRQGEIRLGSEIRIVDGTAHFTCTTDGTEKSIALPPDVILENTLFFPHLKRDFVDRERKEMVYDIFEVREAAVQKTTYSRVGTEKLELCGKTHDAIVLDEINHATGVKLRWWLDVRNGEGLKTEHPSGRVSYRADASVAKRIKAADMNASIMCKVDTAIADVPAISYMKVKASFEPTGLWVTRESLNVPGQRFEGTVKDNVINGVFEIEHRRYVGSGAPPFPPPPSENVSLKEYLEPAPLLESDDPVLAKKAREITRGAKDSWEAACRLSKWVAKNIDYAIPGGGSARKTFDIRAGECGAHSLLLAAFCRSVGIPARVVWGCMYTPNFGGAFGQHGWNEIHMGEAGWIPVDCTASEIDYVDSGHVRIGTLRSAQTALNPRTMEVIAYRVESTKSGGSRAAPSEAPEAFDAYVGDYTGKGGKPVFKVRVQDGCLTVDIPNKAMLALADPDAQGRRYAKLTDRVYVVFRRNDSGKVVELQLHQLIRLRRKAGPKGADPDVPEHLRPYLGTYRLSALQADFEVIYRNGTLAVNDPLIKKTIKLRIPTPFKEGWWKDEFNKHEISFARDRDGTVKQMVIDSNHRFRR